MIKYRIKRKSITYEAKQWDGNKKKMDKWLKDKKIWDGETYIIDEEPLNGCYKFHDTILVDKNDWVIFGSDGDIDVDTNENFENDFEVIKDKKQIVIDAPQNDFTNINKTMEYTVVYAITITAETPEDAAIQVDRILKDDESLPPHFEIIDSSGNISEIDLMNENANE